MHQSKIPASWWATLSEEERRLVEAVRAEEEAIRREGGRVKEPVRILYGSGFNNVPRVITIGDSQ
jgi:hypothetical protein